MSYHVGDRSHVVRDCHSGQVFGKHGFHPWLNHGVGRIEAVCSVARQTFSAQFIVGGHGINFTPDPVPFEQFHGLENLHHDGPGPQQTDDGAVAFRSASQQVHAANDALVNALRLGGHGVVFVVDGDVMDDVVVLHVHVFDTVTNDGRYLVSKGRIPCTDGGVRVSHQERMPVLMLKPFSVEGGSP